MAKDKGLAVAAGPDAAAAERKAAPPEQQAPRQPPDGGEAGMRETVFRLLWQARLTLRGVGATAKEIDAAMPRLRSWVGEARAEELEKAWRGGRG